MIGDFDKTEPHTYNSQLKTNTSMQMMKAVKKIHSKAHEEAQRVTNKQQQYTHQDLKLAML